MFLMLVDLFIIAKQKVRGTPTILANEAAEGLYFYPSQIIINLLFFVDCQSVSQSVNPQLCLIQ